MNFEGTRHLEAAVSVQNVKDQVIAMLYAFGLVNDDEDVVSLEFGDVVSDSVQIAYTIKKRKEG